MCSCVKTNVNINFTFTVCGADCIFWNPLSKTHKQYHYQIEIHFVVYQGIGNYLSLSVYNMIQFFQNFVAKNY